MIFVRLHYSATPPGRSLQKAARLLRNNASQGLSDADSYGIWNFMLMDMWTGVSSGLSQPMTASWALHERPVMAVLRPSRLTQPDRERALG